MDIIQPTTNLFSPPELFLSSENPVFDILGPFHPPTAIQQITPYINPDEIIIYLGPKEEEKTESFNDSSNIDSLTGQTWDNFFTGNSVNFLGTDKADDLYLRVNPEQRLEFSVDGTYFYHINMLFL